MNLAYFFSRDDFTFKTTMRKPELCAMRSGCYHRAFFYYHRQRIYFLINQKIWSYAIRQMEIGNRVFAKFFNQLLYGFIMMMETFKILDNFCFLFKEIT